MTPLWYPEEVSSCAPCLPETPMAAPVLPLNPLWALLEAQKIAHGAKSRSANNPTNYVDPSGLKDQTYDMKNKTGVYNPGYSRQAAGAALMNSIVLSVVVTGVATNPMVTTFTSNARLGLLNALGITASQHGQEFLEMASGTPCPGRIVGPYGFTTAKTLQRLSKAGGPTTRMVSNLSSTPQINRALSTATGQNAEALASQASGTGQHVFDVPNALITELERTGLAIRTTTSFGTEVGTEVRFLPQAAEYVLQFMK